MLQIINLRKVAIQMAYENVIQALLKALGGKDNIASAEHCATRLRIIVDNNELVDKELAENIPECKGYFYTTGQHQFIFGTGKVNEVYQAFNAVLENNGNPTKSTTDRYAHLTPAQRVVRVLADVLIPLIPALVTTGLLMGVRGLLLELGMTMSDDTIALFQVLTDTAFAFLPVLIAYSATKKFGGNPVMGIVVGLMMVAPQLPNAYAVLGGDADPLTVFGIKIYGYQGSIFPAIIAAWILSKLERWLRTWVPQMMDLIVTPFLSLSLTIIAILFILGPIIQIVETFVIGTITSLLYAPLGIGYIVFGALQQALVITGLHHSLGLIEISLLREEGLNIIQPLTTASMAAQFGAAVSAALLMKDKVRRSNMLAATAPTLFGITEPLLFGVNLRSMRVFASGMIGGAVGGFVTYLFKLAATGMGITFLPGLLLYVGNFSGLIQYLIVIIVSAAAGFMLVQAQRNTIIKEIG